MWNFLKLCVELLFPCDELTIYVIKVIFTNNLIIINGEYNTMCLRITHTHTHKKKKKKKKKKTMKITKDGVGGVPGDLVLHRITDQALHVSESNIRWCRPHSLIIYYYHYMIMLPHYHARVCRS